MRAVMVAVAAAATVVLAPAAGATPALCANHSEHSGQPFGNGYGQTYVTACGGDGGPDWGSNATAPRVSTAVQGGVEK